VSSIELVECYFSTTGGGGYCIGIGTSNISIGSPESSEFVTRGCRLGGCGTANGFVLDCTCTFGAAGAGIAGSAFTVTKLDSGGLGLDRNGRGGR
jgi:hypothetical protein